MKATEQNKWQDGQRIVLLLTGAATEALDVYNEFHTNCGREIEENCGNNENV